MTVQQMLDSLSVLQRIMNLELPIKTAYKVYSLAKVINDKREFFINEEKKLITKYNAEINANGGIQFKDPKDQVLFVEEHDSLMSYEVTDLESIEIEASDFGNIKITPMELMMLDGVINIK